MGHGAPLNAYQQGQLDAWAFIGTVSESKTREISKRVMSGPAHKKTSSTSSELSDTLDEEDDHFDERNE
ncbi:hypothetical protein CRE_12405 [Caenorhabditis remanei]|uniref:Uncharacterized protein n=1 Tax=Caenorhabditis remanei TaxID=31234 RepID=E3NPB7_CAERE|nr:hypothetical protein CRE_12405 [Caenorhabditis remanei]